MVKVRLNVSVWGGVGDDIPLFQGESTSEAEGEWEYECECDYAYEYERGCEYGGGEI